MRLSSSDFYHKNQYRPAPQENHIICVPSVGLLEAGVAEDTGEAGETVAEPRVRACSEAQQLSNKLYEKQLFTSWRETDCQIMAIQKEETSQCSSQGVTKRCCLSRLTNSVNIYEPKCGERRGVAGSQPMRTEAQINFGDLTPYLTYGGQVD
jgi:hypothetical protein